MTQSNGSLLDENDDEAFEKRQAALESLVHEFRGLNSHIRAEIDGMIMILRNERVSEKNVSKFIDAVSDHSFLLSYWLDLYEIILRPSLINRERTDLRNIYEKCKKCCDLFVKKSSHKNVRINFNSYDHVPISYWYRFIDTLPYILLDNATKYCPPSSAIDFDMRISRDLINKSKKNLTITVINTGPHVTGEERERVFDLEFRGKGAIQSDKYGRGIGLTLAKMICEIHHGRIHVKSEKNSYVVGGTQYGRFSVIASMPIIV